MVHFNVTVEEDEEELQSELGLVEIIRRCSGAKNGRALSLRSCSVTDIPVTMFFLAREPSGQFVYLML